MQMPLYNIACQLLTIEADFLIVSVSNSLGGMVLMNHMATSNISLDASIQASFSGIFLNLDVGPKCCNIDSSISESVKREKHSDFYLPKA
jgi:hypothetical protein